MTKSAFSVMIAACVFAAACSSGNSNDAAEQATTVPASEQEVRVVEPVVPHIDAPRYVTDGPLRLNMSPQEPVFLYNIYVGNNETEQIQQLWDLWPADLRGYLGIQLIFPSHEPAPESGRLTQLNNVAATTDRLELPLLVQTAAFLGRTGPTDDEMASAFDAHPSLVGVSIAELSAFTPTAINGLSDDQVELIASQITVAAESNALFLWADMGYFGPQVFVDAGAHEKLATLMKKEASRIVIQVKQNGSGERFTSMSAALGLYLGGLSDNWGINSEDWLWWEASLQGYGDPQIVKPLTGAGTTKSEFPVRSRLSYPEALFGTEMLISASAGATVFSIESPNRGSIDLTNREASPAGIEVVFPTLRQIIASHMIPTREQVIDRTVAALWPDNRDPQELRFDQAFRGLYGPSGCTPENELSCVQRQWLPSTGQFGLIPTLPVNSDDDVIAQFNHVIRNLQGSDDDRRRAVGTGLESLSEHSVWAAPGASSDTWFVATSEENTTERGEISLPAFGSGTELAMDLGPQSYAVVDASNPTGSINVLANNFRIDSKQLWTQDVPEREAERVYRDLDAAPNDTTEITLIFESGHAEPAVDHVGMGELTTSWDASTATLAITLDHRGPMQLAIG